jgi:hypothetical protein
VKKFYLVSMLVVIAAMLMTAAAPAPADKPQPDQTGPVRFRLINQTTEKVYMKLDAVWGYNIIVLRNSTRDYTVVRDVYKYRLTACGVTTTGTIDLNLYRSMTIPVCGARLQPYSNVHAAEVPVEIRPITFNVANLSQHTATIKLTGPKTYTIKVGGHRTQSFSMFNGVYKYSVYACGLTSTGSVDLTTYKELNIPVCGGSIAGVQSEHEINLDFTNLVHVMVGNDVGRDAVALFSGPGSYAFYVTTGAPREYTMLRGDYEVSFYGCGNGPEKMEFSAYNNAELVLTCP